MKSQVWPGPEHSARQFRQVIILLEKVDENRSWWKWAKLLQTSLNFGSRFVQKAPISWFWLQVIKPQYYYKRFCSCNVSIVWFFQIISPWFAVAKVVFLEWTTGCNPTFKCKNTSTLFRAYFTIFSMSLVWWLRSHIHHCPGCIEMYKLRL